MATINLGSIKFNWQGAYNGATAYSVDSVVSYNGSSYICKLASTGNLPTNTTYWDQMSAKGTDGTNGTNGTDLTTTLTTQGDLVYRDGSGLQRLGAGTAGQVLQTGGAGANPSWTNLSSDFVLLSTVNASGVSEIAFENLFDSSYNSFKIILTNLHLSNSATPQGQLHLRLGYGATPTYVSNGYYNNGYYVNADVSNSASFSNVTNSRYFDVTYTNLSYGLGFPGNSTTNVRGAYGAELDIVHANTNGRWKTIKGTVTNGEEPFYGRAEFVSVNNDSSIYNAPLTGVKLYNGTGYLMNGTAKLYGLK